MSFRKRLLFIVALLTLLPTLFVGGAAFYVTREGALMMMAGLIGFGFAKIARRGEDVVRARGELEALERVHAQEIQKIEALAKIDATVFARFTKECRAALATCETELTQPTDRVKRVIHTLRGNAQMFGLTKLQDLAQSFEGLSQETVLLALKAEVESLAKIHSSLFSARARGEESSQLSALVSAAEGLAICTEKPGAYASATAGFRRDLLVQVKRQERVRVAAYVEIYDRMLAEWAPALGKEVLPIVLRGNVKSLPADAMSQLNDMLVHCVRNALDHGIEAPATRLAQGKAAAGRLTLTVDRVARDLHIELIDDGSGIDLNSLRTRAVESGVLDHATAAEATDAQTLELIFAPGFTTMVPAGLLSGRGYGLSAVREFARAAGGDALVELAPNGGTRICLQISDPDQRDARGDLETVLLRSDVSGQIQIHLLMAEPRLQRASLHIFCARELTGIDHQILENTDLPSPSKGEGPELFLTTDAWLAAAGRDGRADLARRGRVVVLVDREASLSWLTGDVLTSRFFLLAFPHDLTRLSVALERNLALLIEERANATGAHSAKTQTAAA